MGGFRFTFTAVQKVFNIKEYKGKIKFIPSEMSKQNCLGHACDICKKHIEELQKQEENNKENNIGNNENKLTGNGNEEGTGNEDGNPNRNKQNQQPVKTEETSESSKPKIEGKKKKK